MSIGIDVIERAKRIEKTLEEARRFISSRNQKNLSKEIESNRYKLNELHKILEKTEDQGQVIEITAEILENERHTVQSVYSICDTPTQQNELSDARKILRQTKDINEKQARRNELLRSHNSSISQEEFEATLRWFGQQGDGQADLEYLLKARFDPPYFSEEIRNLFSIAETNLRSKLTQQGLELSICQVFGDSTEVANIISKDNIIIDNNSSWTLVMASGADIAELRMHCPVRRLNIHPLEGKGAPQMRKYRVQLIAPINADFKATLKSIHVEFLQSLGGLEVAVSVPNADARILAQLRAFKEVNWIKPYEPKIRITQDLQDLETNVSPKMIEAALSEVAKDLQPKRPKSIPTPGILIASFFTPEDREQAEDFFRSQGIRIAEVAGSKAIVIDLNGHSNPMQALELIKEQIGLRALEEDIVDTLFNNIARGIIAQGVIPSNLHSDEACLGLTGKDQIIGMADSGLDTGDTDRLHTDFQGKVRILNSSPLQPRYDFNVMNPGENTGPSDQYSGHGTHVAGSALGKGSFKCKSNLSVKGVATDAELIFRAIEQRPRWTARYIFRYLRKNGTYPPTTSPCGTPFDLTKLFQEAFEHNARIYSISWGKTDESFPGGYDPRCYALDEFVWFNKEFLVIAAAGNFGKCVASPGIAKNCITIGASENKRSGRFSETYGYRWPYDFPPNHPAHANGLVDSIDDIAAFSSPGPCETGRRKPDVVAPGTFILSTRSSALPQNHYAERPCPEAPCHYMYMHGTSTATPLVAGSAALIREYLQEYQTRWESPKAILVKGEPNKPTAALVKAILIHSAEYLNQSRKPSSVRADNYQGWGRVYLNQALNPPEPMRVLFIDEAGGLHNEEAPHKYTINLTNDSIPLRVTLVYTDAPGEHLQNNLNLVLYPPKGQYYCGNDFDESRTLDDLNNVESCYIQSPQRGRWKINVLASSITQGPQDYALVISGGGVHLEE